MSDATFWWLIVLTVLNIALLLKTFSSDYKIDSLRTDLEKLQNRIGTRNSCIWRRDSYPMDIDLYSVTDMITYLYKEISKVNTSKCDVWERCRHQFSRLERIDEDMSLLLNKLGYKIDVEPAKPRRRVIVEDEEEEDDKEPDTLKGKIWDILYSEDIANLEDKLDEIEEELIKDKEEND